MTRLALALLLLTTPARADLPASSFAPADRPLVQFGEHYARSVAWQWSAVLCLGLGGVGVWKHWNGGVTVGLSITGALCSLAALMESTSAAKALGFDPGTAR